MADGDAFFVVVAVATRQSRLLRSKCQPSPLSLSSVYYEHSAVVAAMVAVIGGSRMKGFSQPFRVDGAPAPSILATAVVYYPCSVWSSTSLRWRSRPRMPSSSPFRLALSPGGVQEGEAVCQEVSKADDDARQARTFLERSSEERGPLPAWQGFPRLLRATGAGSPPPERTPLSGIQFHQ
ncbi:hypothetical protein Taro_005300 [Colocasia esculenta]|uniref:Uncharacterized protein n=1 Tax=Colocasia esculenta TaxID=4460 RepID=A0A843TRY3_COLES|nr:hypothetical protein [Colocasia esculenta]